MMARNAPSTLAMQTPVHAFTHKLTIAKTALQIPQFAKKILTVLLGLSSKISIANALLLYAILLLEFAKLFHLPAKLVSPANNVANPANQEMHVTYQLLLAPRTISVKSFAIALIILAMILLLAPKTTVTLTLEHVFMNLWKVMYVSNNANPMLIASNGLLNLNLTKSAKVLYAIKKTKIASFMPLLIKPIVQTNNQKALSVLNVFQPMLV
jgi:hypothetical protein